MVASWAEGEVAAVEQLQVRYKLKAWAAPCPPRTAGMRAATRTRARAQRALGSALVQDLHYRVVMQLALSSPKVTAGKAGWVAWLHR